MNKRVAAAATEPTAALSGADRCLLIAAVLLASVASILCAIVLSQQHSLVDACRTHACSAATTNALLHMVVDKQQL